MVKKFVLMAVACACVGSYTVAGAQGTLDVKPDPAKTCSCRTGSAYGWHAKSYS